MIGTTDKDYLVNILVVTEAAVYNKQVEVFQAMQAGPIYATLVTLPAALYGPVVHQPPRGADETSPPADRGG